MREETGPRYIRLLSAEPRAVTTIAIYASAFWTITSFIYSIAYVNSFCSACIRYLSLTDIIGIAFGTAGLLTLILIVVFLLALPFLAPREATLPFIGTRLGSWISKLGVMQFLRILLPIFLLISAMPVLIVQIGRMLGQWDVPFFPDDTFLQAVWAPLFLLTFAYHYFLWSRWGRRDANRSLPLLAGLGISIPLVVIIYGLGDLSGGSALKRASVQNCARLADEKSCTSVLVLGSSYSIVVRKNDISLIRTESMEEIRPTNAGSFSKIWKELNR